jgi:hypothetical protein
MTRLRPAPGGYWISSPDPTRSDSGNATLAGTQPTSPVGHFAHRHPVTGLITQAPGRHHRRSAQPPELQRPPRPDFRKKESPTAATSTSPSAAQAARAGRRNIRRHRPCRCCRIWPALIDDPVGRCGGGRPGAADIIIVARPNRPSSSVRPDQTSVKRNRRRPRRRPHHLPPRRLAPVEEISVGIAPLAPRARA